MLEDAPDRRPPTSAHAGVAPAGQLPGSNTRVHLSQAAEAAAQLHSSNAAAGPNAIHANGPTHRAPLDEGSLLAMLMEHDDADALEPGMQTIFDAVL